MVLRAISNVLNPIYGDKMTQSDNPLRKYFRQPSIYVRLPSGGKYYPSGTLDMPPNGELPILPMTAVDEITSRTPDALFNGSAVMEIMRSCVPNILDPWAIPSLDLNMLLVAVRMASYGHEMEINTTCPKCGESHELTLDLREVLDSIKPADYDSVVNTGDLVISFCPMNYRRINEAAKIQFEDQKLIQMLTNSEMTEEDKMHRLTDAFKNITTMTINAIAETIQSIKTDTVMVTEHQQIAEFLTNCPKSMFELVKNHAVKLREETDLKPLHIICDKCEHPYDQPFTLDMSNFFENAS
jgi:RNase P subunit RPR2